MWRCLDPRQLRAALGVGRGELGAEVEQLVLDAVDDRQQVRPGRRGLERHADQADASR